MARYLGGGSIVAPVGFLILPLALAACEPTVRVQAPDKPIVINMNIKIEQEVRVKLEKDVQTLLDGNEELF